MPLAELVLTPSLGLSIAGAVLATAIIVILRDWRIILPALLAHYVFLAAIIAHITEPNIMWTGIATNAYAIVLPLAGLVVTAVLVITMLELEGWPRRKRREKSESLSLTTEARVAADAVAHAVFTQEHVLHFLTLIMCAAGAYAVAQVYPLIGNPYLDFTFFWLGLSGLFVLVFARNMLKIGLGLLIALSSVILLESVSPEAATIVSAAVFSAVAILIALVTASLCAVLRDRLGTISLDELRRS